MKKIISKINLAIMLVMMNVQTVFAEETKPPTQATDVKFFNDLQSLVFFGVAVVAFVIALSAGLRWGWNFMKMQHEEDPAKLAELERTNKKQVMYAILGLSSSIVTAILSFFM